MTSSSLWNDKMLLAAYDRLTDDEREKYRKWGNSVFSVDHADPKQQEEDVVRQIEMMYRDGIKYADLNEYERSIVKKQSGGGGGGVEVVTDDAGCSGERCSLKKTTS